MAAPGRGPGGLGLRDMLTSDTVGRAPLVSIAAAPVGLLLATLLLSACAGDELPETQSLTQDGAWCWFQDPRAVYRKGDRERTYMQWITRDGRLQVGAYDHVTGHTEIHTVKQDWDRDDHNVGAFVVRPDGRLMVFYARHNGHGLFARTAAHPEDIRTWGDEVIVSDADRISYVHPVYLSDEDMYFAFWRGPSWKPTFATSTDGQSWSESQILIQEAGREDADIRPYLKVSTDGVSSIHFAFTDGHPRDEPHNSVYYLRYQQSRFTRADGAVIGALDSLPIRHSDSDLVYDASETSVRAWVWDLALDANGAPVIAYTRLPGERDHRYHYARWTGTLWEDYEISPAGRWFPETPVGTVEPEPHYSGGIDLHPSNPSIALLSRQRGNGFEIERWLTPDGGRTWEWQSITRSTEGLNVRPVVPESSRPGDYVVLWMAGPYVHYTDYSTGIRLARLID